MITFVCYGCGNGDGFHPVQCVLSVYEHFNGNRMKAQVSIHNCVWVLITSLGIPNGKTHANNVRPDFRMNSYRRQHTYYWYVTFSAKFMFRHSLMFAGFPQEPHVPKQT